MMLEVHICNREGSLLRAFALGDTPEVIVGRDDDCDIRINSQSISREHCSIEREGEEFILRDLKSKRGTLYNGERVNRMPVRDGMAVEVGPVVLKFYNGAI